MYEWARLHADPSSGFVSVEQVRSLVRRAEAMAVDSTEANPNCSWLLSTDVRHPMKVDELYGMAAMF